MWDYVIKFCVIYNIRNDLYPDTKNRVTEFENYEEIEEDLKKYCKG